MAVGFRLFLLEVRRCELGILLESILEVGLGELVFWMKDVCGFEWLRHDSIFDMVRRDSEIEFIE